MKKKRLGSGKSIFIITLSIFIIMTAVDSPGKALTSKEMVEGELAQKLDQYLTRITPFGFSGALLAAKDGRIILNKGYGMAIRSANIPNTSETVFSTGSITKQFTAAGIMKLEMMGKLRTEDPITKYFDDVPQDKREITLHHLLTHTSGIVDALGPDYVTAPREETMRKTLDAPLRFEPGEQFGYSNAAYSMLAAVIEKVSGVGYEEFMNKNIFAPAGMKFTGYRMPEWNKQVVAHWYVGEKDNGIPLEKNYPQWHLLGNGGILSTTDDMYKWHLALLDDRVLSEAAKKKMFTPYLNDYGYGWDVLEREMGLLIQHDGGSTLGNSAEMRRYIDAGIVTILFCNQSFGQQTLMEAVRDKIEALIFGGEVTIPFQVEPAGAEKLRKFEGIYRLETGGSLDVKQEERRLIVSARGQDAITVLFDPDHPNPGYFEKLNALSESVFDAAVKGDYQPLVDILQNREQRMGPVHDLIEQRLRMVKPRTGGIQKVMAKGTLPSTFDGQRAAMTYVELKGENGSVYFVLIWRGMKNVGVGPTPPPGEMAIPFMPFSKEEFAGFRIDSGISTRLGFRQDDKGNVLGLTIPGKEGIIAVKEAD